MKYKIRNFGPITDGYTGDDEFIRLDGVTVFTGGQGTGKSSVAKSLSTMMWLEKALLRYDFSEKQLMARGKFKSHFTYHGIVDYFQKNTELDYQGRYYRFKYAQEQLTIEQLSITEEIDTPKIMYVPSERNFLSSSTKLSMVAGLQPSLATFLDEYENAKRSITVPITLPVDQGKFSYDKLNDVSWIERKKNKTRLSNASSGYQSLVPLFLVTDYLANSIDQEKMPISVHQMRIIREKLNELVHDYYDLFTYSLISVLKENAYISFTDIQSSPPEARRVLKRFRPSHYVNVVEEPEQNLFPDSQVKMVQSLLGYQNRKELNQLIITTHSPYVLSAVTLAVACSMAFQRNETVQEELGRIVARDAWLKPEKLTVYEIDGNGIIKKLETYADLPSDNNYLNNALGSFNVAFEQIMDLEESL
jgi:hypothetical protein